MRLIRHMRTMAAVYWAPTEMGPDGRPASYADPESIKCRWDEDQVTFTDVRGQQTMSKAVVFCDRVVAPLGVLMLGTLDDVTDTARPFAQDGAWEVRQFARITKLRGKRNDDPNKTLMVAYL